LDNEITTDYYGTTNIGAWDNGVGAIFAARENLYLISKFLMGQSSSFDNSVELVNAGASNVISGNHIYGSLGVGVNIAGLPASPTTNTIVSGNWIANHPSVGIILSEGQTGTQISGNFVSDSSISLRCHHMNYSGETIRQVYVFRNRFWLPLAGDHIFLHFYDIPSVYRPEFWFYQNSFSGGLRGVAPGISNAHLSDQDISGCRFFNNIFSGISAYFGNIGIGFWTNSAMVGAFDYNELTPPLLTYPASTPAAWAGAHNVTSLV
jgi:hypothetical protein